MKTWISGVIGILFPILTLAAGTSTLTFAENLRGPILDSQPSCAEIFRSAELAQNQLAQRPSAPTTPPIRRARIGEFRRDFKFSPHYTVEVTDQSPIHDQCSLGTCTLQSWTSKLEQASRYPVSSEYLAASFWLYKSIDVLRSDDLTAEISLGNHAIGGRNRIREFGVIPPSAWKNGTEFQSAAKRQRIDGYVEAIIARSKWERDQSADPEVRAKIMDAAEVEIRGLFLDTVGPMPEEFLFEGVTYTPSTYAKAFFPELYRPTFIMLADQGSAPRTTLKGRIGQDGAYMRTPIENIEKVIVQLLDKNQNVSIAYDHRAEFIDKNTGIMSIAAFEHPRLADPLTSEQRDRADLDPSLHAVQIVGYELDPKTGEVLKWKIKNSWGTQNGDGGYYHMYADYFRAFFNSASFDPNGIYFPPVDYVEPIQLRLKFPAAPVPAP